MEAVFKLFQLVCLHAPWAFLAGGLLSIATFLEDKKGKVSSLLAFVTVLVSLTLSYFSLEISTIISLFYITALFSVFKRFSKILNKPEEGISFVSILVGVGVSSAVFAFKGFDVYWVRFLVDTVGMGAIIYANLTYSIVPDILLASTFLGIFFPDKYFLSSYSLILLVIDVFIMREVMSYARVHKEEEVEGFTPRFHRYSASILLTIMILTFMFVNLMFFENVRDNLKVKVTEEVKRYADFVVDVYIKEGGKERVVNLTPGNFKPDFVNKVLIVKNGKVVYPFSGNWADVRKNFERQGMRFLSLRAGTEEIVVVYNPPAFIYVRGLLLYFTLSATAVLFGAFFLQRQYFRFWTDLLELEINRKTQEVTAANEELTAMNEELLSMNEELENMYKNLSDLNTKIVEFLKFVREVRVREPVDEIFHRLYEAISGILSTPPVGYEIVDSETGDILRSHLIGHGEYSHDVKLGKYIFRVIYPDVVKFSEDEEKFIEIISTVAEIMVLAHDSYEFLEKSKNFMSNVLELLNRVLVVDSKEEAEQLLLKYGMDLFDDITSVAIAWKEELKQEVIIKIMRRDSDSIYTRILKRGIIKYAMMTGEEYLVRNVDEDDIFYKDVAESKSAFAIPLRTKEGVVGVFEIERGRTDAFTEEDMRILRIFARIVAITLQRVEYLVDIKKTFLGTVEALTYAIELKDPYTHGHSRRVADHSIAIAKALGLPKETIERIELAALLHDIGKIGIRGSVLDKPARLTDDEYEEIKKHPVLGAELVGKIETLRDIAKIIRHHHERCDGKGYPDGLTCDEIPLESKIIAIADAFDAMISDRPYRKALSVEEALEIIEKDGGNQWDAAIAEIAVRVFREMHRGKLFEGRSSK